MTSRWMGGSAPWVTAGSQSFRRWLSAAAMEATREVPKTPDGNNPYKVLEVDLKQDTSLDEIKDQFKKLAIKYHPDSPGGSNERMSEINAAHKIVRQNHNTVLRNLKDAEAMASSRGASQSRARRPSKRARDTKEEELARSGGVSATQKVRDMNSQKWKNAKEIEIEWLKVKEDSAERVAKMMTRFEVALEHCEYFKQTTMASEITVRERWLRKNYCKTLWEDIHEMRTELLKRGARNLQQAEMAEEMVAFASAQQKKLNEDFSRQAQRHIKAQGRIFIERAVKLAGGFFFVMYAIYYIVTGFWRNSFVRTYKPAMMGA